MEYQISKICRNALLATGLLAALVVPAMAVDVQQSTELSYSWVVDWSATTTGVNHLNYASFTAAEHPRGVTPKYFDFDISNDFPAARGHCFEMATSYGPSATIADTEILVKKDDGKWARLSDDIGGTRFSRARFYFDDNAITQQSLTAPSFGASPTKIRVAAYSTDFNNNDFFLTFTSVGNLTQAQCFSNTGVAAAFIDRHEYVTIVRAI